MQASRSSSLGSSLCVVFSLIAIPAAGFAEQVSVTWQGGVGGDWSLASNWTPDAAVPNNGNAGNTYAASIGANTVNLTENITVDSLALNGSTLSGAHTLTSGYLGLSSANTLSSGITLKTAGPLVFAGPAATLANQGTLEFGSSAGFSASTAVLTNHSTGTIRFSSGGRTIGGASSSPFAIVNHGTVLSDNANYNTLYTPFSQSSTGLTRVVSHSLVIAGSGGTIAGTLRADSGAYLELSGSGPVPAPTISGHLILDDTSVVGSGHVVASYTHLSGSLASGILHTRFVSFSDAFENKADATLAWGDETSFKDSSATFSNRGTFLVDGIASTISSAAVLTNQSTGTIRFSSSGRTIGSSSVSPFSIVNHGTILADNSASNALHTPITNDGLIHVASGSSLTLGRTFVQTGGELRVSNASLSVSSGQTLVFQGGLLRASGDLLAPLSLTDTNFEIGDAQSAENLFIGGNVALFSGASVSFDLNGTIQGESHDHIGINGSLTLGGTLSLRISEAFASNIQPDDEFVMVSATSIGGAFSNVSSGQRIVLPDGVGSLLVTITATEIRLGDFAAIPEPSSWGLLTGATALTFGLRRRRHSSRA